MILHQTRRKLSPGVLVATDGEVSKHGVTIGQVTADAGRWFAWPLDAVLPLGFNGKPAEEGAGAFLSLAEAANALAQKGASLDDAKQSA